MEKPTKHAYQPFYPKDAPSPQELERKRMLADIESMTARVLLMSSPTSNARKDAMRIRKRWGFSVEEYRL